MPKATHNGEDPIYPAVTNVLRNESHEEWSRRWTKRDKQCPDAHLLTSFLPEKCFRDDSTDDRKLHNLRYSINSLPSDVCGTDEEGHKRSAYSHSCVAVTDRTSDIAYSRASC